MRKTKIICTLGPSVDSKDMLKQLMKAGMNVGRMNFSHGTHEDHKKRIDLFKEVRDELGMSVALLLDMKGPKIRIGTFEKGEVTLQEGDSFALLNKDTIGDNTKVSIDYKDLYKDVFKGGRILINDGLVELEIKEVKGKDIHCTVINGGIISNRKGVNVPEVEIRLPAFTEKDIEDIKFGIENDVDFIAASFVRKASDVVEIKKLLEKYGGQDVNVIAKIENRQGIKNIDDIIKVSDGIMVARGDMGVEIPVEEVPIVQKSIIEKCYRTGKPVITATQMLDSMIRNPIPTRAEASDIANAIYDGTSAIMLSGETASGKYPIEALEVMCKIAGKAENSMSYWKRFSGMNYTMASSTTNAISHATCTTAMDLNASAIITVTHSGRTARMISRFRPACPIIATTVYPKVQRQLALSWGVIPFLVPEVATTDEMFDVGVEKAIESGKVQNGDLVIITAGIPVGVSGTTNLLKVHIVGRVLVKGTGINMGQTTGELCVVRAIEEAEKTFADGNIIVAPYTNNEMLPLLKRASGIIVEEGGTGSHAATIGLTLEIPVVVGAENATKILKSGSVVTIDSSKGIVFYGAPQ
jgi:pyruvate kinase